MRPTHGWKRTFRLFRDPAAEVREEIEAHFAGQGAEAGVEADAAVHATLRAAGPRARWRFAARLDWLWQDVRFALRGLRRRPGFAVSAVLILGLVVAANASVLAVVNAYLVRELPYPAADRVVFVSRTPILQATMSSDAPVPDGLNSIEWPRTDAILEYSAGAEFDGFGLVSDGDPTVVGGAWVTAGFFPIVGARTELGRVFTEEEVKAEAPVAVIGHGLWERRYGSDPAILGRTIRAYSGDRPAGTEAFTIIGVLSEDFWTFVGGSDLYVPLRGTRRPMLARLAPGVTPDGAALHLTRIARERLPEVDARWSMHVTPLREALFAEIRPGLRVLAGGVSLLLLIAAANLTLLLLIRTAGRDFELSIRSALGAGRGRIFRQLVVEGLAIAVVAGVGGLLAAEALLSLVGPLVPAALGAPLPGGGGRLAIEGRAIGWTALVTGGMGLVFGAVPLLLRRVRVGVLGSGRGVGSQASRRSQTWLVAAEVALSLALLAGAGVLVRSTLDLGRRELGFEPDGVQVASLALREPSYPDPASQAGFYERVLQAYGARGEVALSDRYPFDATRGERLAARGVDPAETEDLRAIHHVVSEDYFGVLGIPLVAGRGVTGEDRMSSEPVIVISRSLADRLWPGEEALGRYVRTGSWDNLPDLEHSPWRRVVGVAADVRTTRTGENWPDTYVPFRQRPGAHMHALLPSGPGDGAAAVAVARFRAAVGRVDERQPVTVMPPLTTSVDGELTRPRFLTGLMLGFAAFALGLALVGLHAVVSYAASQRRREVAIRAALGATRRELDRLLVRGGLVAVGAGAAAGLALAVAGGRLLESQLYGLPALQPLTYALVAALAVGAAIAAIRATARRAGGADPAVVLREP